MVTVPRGECANTTIPPALSQAVSFAPTRTVPIQDITNKENTTRIRTKPTVSKQPSQNQINRSGFSPTVLLFLAYNH